MASYLDLSVEHLCVCACYELNSNSHLESIPYMSYLVKESDIIYVNYNLWKLNLKDYMRRRGRIPPSLQYYWSHFRL